MNLIATLPNTDRADLFQEAANRRGVATALIEKDFWVCWVLKQLFALPDLGPHFIFKGGTTLSKVFNVIQRFSEDIDISINREYLGFGGGQDPENMQGTNKTKRQLEKLQLSCREKITNDLLPLLNETFAQLLDKTPKSKKNSWKLAQDERDLQTLLFTYPTLRPHSEAYLQQIVRIELGARSDHWPAKTYQITPYLAEEFPQLFAEAACTVKVLEAERTFWEKATLLHEYYSRDDNRTGDRLSRHFYDLHALANSPIGASALHRIDLLERVVKHKTIFFKTSRANYEEAANGNIHLIPSAGKLAALRASLKSH